jgi:hypothetical protein
MPPWMATNFFPSRKRCCPSCLERQLKVDDELVTEYYHRGVVCHLVRCDLAVPLDAELQQPGEGEVTAAKRLLERVFTNHPRLFDVVLGDALYCEEPFFNFCLEHGRDVVAVLKSDNRLLKRDADLRFSQLAPQHSWREGKRDIQAWDLDGFTTMTGVNGPVRVLHTHETWTERQLVAGKYEKQPKVADWWWAATITSQRLPAQQLCRAGHSRWDIENDNFNVLAKSWGLDHCFKHSPKAILNFILAIFIVHVLLQSFYKRNLKPSRRVRLTFIALARDLYAAWVTGGRILPSQEERSETPDTS